MSRAALVIHSFSYPFIKNVAHFIHEMIQSHFDEKAELFITDTVDAAKHDENTSVFLIGENIPIFQRKPGCTYIYLNFSVVTVLGRPWETGIEARLAIRSKRKMLAKRLPSIDILLDYYPPQTEVLRRQLNIPVFGFDVATLRQQEFRPMQDRAYDVCFVGSLNQRRQSVCDAIEAMGLTLSPSKDIVIEDASAQSRVCLNVHSVKSHHFETPRFVAALSAGTPIVSELSFCSDAIVGRQYTTEGSCADLPLAVANLLSQGDQLNKLGHDAQLWYNTTYLPRARTKWRETCDVIRAVA